MADFELRTLGRKILLIVAILSVFVIGEMILVSAEEPAPSVQQQIANEAPRQNNRILLKAGPDWSGYKFTAR